MKGETKKKSSTVWTDSKDNQTTSTNNDNNNNNINIDININTNIRTLLYEVAS
jgi:hypothetical protein